MTMNALDLTVTRATIDNARRRRRDERGSANADADAAPRRCARAATPSASPTPARIHDDAYGLFRVSYQDDDGQTRRALATQFEPGDARRLRRCGTSPTAAPCFR